MEIGPGKCSKIADGYVNTRRETVYYNIHGVLYENYAERNRRIVDPQTSPKIE